MFTLDERVVAFDSETTGLDPRKGARPFIWATCDQNGKTRIYHCNKKKDMRAFKKLMADPTVHKIAHNLKFDWRMANFQGVKIVGPLHDSMIMATLANENESSHRLDFLAEKYLGADNKGAYVLDQWFRKNAYQLRKRFGNEPKGSWKRYDAVPWDIMKNYVTEDVVNCLKLAFMYSGPMEQMYPEIYTQEMRFLPALMRIEDRGHLIDIQYFKKQQLRAKVKLRKMDARLRRMAKNPTLNLASSPQLAAAFDRLGVESPVKTKTGANSWAKDALAQIDHPFAKLLLERRGLAKLSSTYYSSLAKKAAENDGVIHATFWQTGSKKKGMQSVRTGRLSSSDPNFQNIPRKDKTVRRGFIPRDGFVLFYFDYRQVEMVLFAIHAADPALLKRLKDGEDLHAATAELLFGDKFRAASTAIKKELRQVAKTINFGIVYGMGVRTTTKTLRELFVDLSPQAKRAAGVSGQVTEKEAKKILHRYHEKMPAVGQYSRECMWKISRHGYVDDIFGRRYHVPNDLRYKAVNAQIQGCASNVMKRGIIRVDDLLLAEEAKSGIVNQVHDEVAVEIHESELHLVPKIIECLEDHETFEVPILVDVNWSDTNWADKKEWDDAA